MISLSIPEIKGNEWKYIKDCLDSNWVSSAGSYVDLFEENFKKYIGSQSAVVTMNGTAALHLALICAGINPGDEVLVPSMTFVSPVNAIRYVGAEPVFVDVCRDTYVMDADKIEELICEKTKAIIPVHIYGHPVEMKKIMEIAEKYKLWVIEDATESLGAQFQGKNTGTIGHIGCFSFNGNKIITTGAGGMLVTNDLKIGERAKYLSNQTKTVIPSGSFIHEEVGYNYRMPNILAAMGVAQLENLEEFIYRKNENSKLYSNLLVDVEQLNLPVQKEWAKNVNWLYSVVINEKSNIDRDIFIDDLKKNGIEARGFFMPVHEMPPYGEFRHGDMTNTLFLSKRGVCLPSSVGISEEEIKIVCKCIRNLYSKS